MLITLIIVFIVVPLAALALAVVVLDAIANAEPDPEDERMSAERMSYLRGQAEREGRYVRLEDWQ